MQEKNRRVASSNSDRAARIIFNTELLLKDSKNGLPLGDGKRWV